MFHVKHFTDFYFAAPCFVKNRPSHSFILSACWKSFVRQDDFWFLFHNKTAFRFFLLGRRSFFRATQALKIFYLARRFLVSLPQ